MSMAVKVVFLMITVKINVGLDIRNVSLHIDESSIYLTSGTVSLDYRGTSGTYICHYGDQKNWGKREADTACKQLHYDGGWPYDVPMGDSSQSQKLNNFDCDETVSDLNDCEYYVTQKCKDSKLAGVQCYDLFAVQLVGGMSSNMGRVEVKYNDQWASVCYESSDDSSQDWSFANAQVVCRELGFPGTMLAKQGGLGYGDRDYVINGYQCREDLREQSLKSCYPDAPQEVLQESNSSCGFGQAGRSNDAVVICAVPGYIGCFNNDDVPNSELEKLTLQNMTINTCRDHCRELIYRYAFLQQGDTCHCAGVYPATPLGDTMCRLECSGDDNQVCGDVTTSSVYDGDGGTFSPHDGFNVAYGTCVDPLGRGNRMFYFGDIFDAFECEDGMELVNATAIQCIMTSSMDGFIWNDTRTPECRDIHVGEDEEVGLWFISIIAIALGVLIACLIVVLVCLLVRCIYLDKKQKRYYVTIQDLEEKLASAEQLRRIQEEHSNRDEQMQDEKLSLFQSFKKWINKKRNISDEYGARSDPENIAMANVAAGNREAQTHSGGHKGDPSATYNMQGPSTSRPIPATSNSSTDSKQQKPSNSKKGNQHSKKGKGVNPLQGASQTGLSGSASKDLRRSCSDSAPGNIESKTSQIGRTANRSRSFGSTQQKPNTESQGKNNCEAPKQSKQSGKGSKANAGTRADHDYPSKPIESELSKPTKEEETTAKQEDNENAKVSSPSSKGSSTGDGKINPSKFKSFKHRKTGDEANAGKSDLNQRNASVSEEDKGPSDDWDEITENDLDETKVETSSPDSAGNKEGINIHVPESNTSPNTGDRKNKGVIKLIPSFQSFGKGKKNAEDQENDDDKEAASESQKEDIGRNAEMTLTGAGDQKEKDIKNSMKTNSQESHADKEQSRFKLSSFSLSKKSSAKEEDDQDSQNTGDDAHVTSQEDAEHTGLLKESTTPAKEVESADTTDSNITEEKKSLVDRMLSSLKSKTDDTGKEDAGGKETQTVDTNFQASPESPDDQSESLRGKEGSDSREQDAEHTGLPKESTSPVSDEIKNNTKEVESADATDSNVTEENKSVLGGLLQFISH